MPVKTNKRYWALLEYVNFGTVVELGLVRVDDYYVVLHQVGTASYMWMDRYAYTNWIDRGLLKWIA